MIDDFGSNVFIPKNDLNGLVEMAQLMMIPAQQGFS